jgi:hypothetical protein
MRRLLLRTLERWTGDRYLRATLLRDSAQTPAELVAINAAIVHARRREHP